MAQKKAGKFSGWISYAFGQVKNRFPEQSDNGNYSNDGLIPVSGHEYRLDFMYDGVAVTSTTQVPSAPVNVTFSSSTIEVMGGMPPMPMSKAPHEGIEISWDNEEGDYYIIEGKTTSTSTIQDYDDDDELPSKSFKHNYTQGSSTSLSSSDFNYYGTYTISVSHIRYEYAVMSQGGSTSSTTLVDVKGNIDGGYGIFTGISSVKKSIRVYRNRCFISGYWEIGLKVMQNESIKIKKINQIIL